MMSSFGTTLNTHLRLSSIGATRMAAAAIDISGVLASAAISISGRLTGVSDEPISTSTFSSVMSLRAFCAPLVGSDSSSSAK